MQWAVEMKLGRRETTASSVSIAFVGEPPRHLPCFRRPRLRRRSLGLLATTTTNGHLIAIYALAEPASIRFKIH